MGIGSESVATGSRERSASGSGQRARAGSERSVPVLGDIAFKAPSCLCIAFCHVAYG
jgi:hypothetical protein